MIQPENAVALLKTLIAVEVEVVKAINTKRGLSKRLQRIEHQAVKAVFYQLTGADPTVEQIATITDY